MVPRVTQRAADRSWACRTFHGLFSLLSQGLCWHLFPSWERRPTITASWWFNPIFILLSRDVPVIGDPVLGWLGLLLHRTERQEKAGAFTRHAYLLPVARGCLLWWWWEPRKLQGAPEAATFPSPSWGGQSFQSACHPLWKSLRVYTLVWTYSMTSDETNDLSARKKATHYT